MSASLSEQIGMWNDSNVAYRILHAVDEETQRSLCPSPILKESCMLAVDPHGKLVVAINARGDGFIIPKKASAVVSFVKKYKT